MGLETASTISQLNAAWPTGTDLKSQGDDHLRLIKKVLQDMFPSPLGDKPVTQWPFPVVAYSTEFAITSGGLVTFVHNKGYGPASIILSLVCKATDAGYAVGDTIMPPIGGNTPYAPAGGAQLTTVNVRYSSLANCFSAGNKSTGVQASLTNSKWGMYMTVTF